jgi:GT2 family glycosyltransferase
MDVLLSIIIVSYNVRDFLAQTLRSVQKATRSISTEIFVVDNHSEDGSAHLVASEFSEVQLIRNTKNVGFARANNQALVRARGRFLVLLNPDTIVQEDTFQTLIQFFDTHPDAGMVGCKILNPDGTLQLACRRSFPTPWVAFTKLVGLGTLFPKSRWFGRYNLTYLDPDQTTEVDAISGSFMMVRREVVGQVGLLDERFFMYGEDLDWCYRVKQAGWKIYYVPSTKIVHYKGASSEKSDRDTLVLFYRAMLQFVQKHFRGRYLFLPQWFLISGIGIRLAFSFVYRWLRKLALPLIDLIGLNVALAAGIFLRFGSLSHWSDFWIVNAIYSAVWLASFFFFDLYERQKFSVSRAVGAVLLGWILNGALTFFFKQVAFSRAVVLFMGLAAFFLLPGWRLAAQLLIRSRKFTFFRSLQDALIRKKTVLVGKGESIHQLIRRLRERFDTGYEVVGVVLPQENGEEHYEVPVLGTVENLPWILRKEGVSEVIFSAESLNYELILKLISRAQGLDVNFKTAASDTEVIIGRSSVDHIGDIPLVNIDYKLGHEPNRILKRSFDLLFSGGTLIFLSIPYFYWRVVRGKKVHRVPILTEKNSQVTVHVFEPFRGDFYSLRFWQKIPLFWDIFRGRLSFVGAELTLPEKNENKKVHLKPGLTGLVQLYKNRRLNTVEKEKYELFYLKNYSPFFDIEILAKSMFKF